LLLGLVVASPERSPWRNTEPLGLTHGDDVALEVSVRGTPAALVHNELSETMVTSILIGLRYDPGWRVGDSEVENLALVGERVEAAHHLFDRSCVVPPMKVQLCLPLVRVHFGIRGQYSRCQCSLS